MSTNKFTYNTFSTHIHIYPYTYTKLYREKIYEQSSKQNVHVHADDDDGGNDVHMLHGSKL